jgi:hypothetical protein
LLSDADSEGNSYSGKCGVAIVSLDKSSASEALSLPDKLGVAKKPNQQDLDFMTISAIAGVPTMGYSKQY